MSDHDDEKHDRSAPFEVHDWKYEDDEYGSLASGGSYEVYRCSVCGKRSYSQLPD
jgi:hypothetical protein